MIEMLYSIDTLLNQPQFLKFFFLSISIIIPLIYGWLIYLQNNKEVINRVFIFLSILSAGCILSDLLIDVFLKIYHINIGALTVLDMPIGIFLSYYYIKLSFYFPYTELKKRPKIFLKVLQLFCLIFSIMAFTNLCISDRKIINGIYYRTYHIFYYIIIFYILFQFIIAGMHFLFRLKKIKDPFYVQEVKKTLIITIGAIFFLPLIFIIILPVFNIKELDFLGKAIPINIAIIVIGNTLLNYKVLSFRESLRELLYYCLFFIFFISPFFFTVYSLSYIFFTKAKILFFILSPGIIFLFIYVICSFYRVMKNFISFELLDKFIHKTNIQYEIMRTAFLYSHLDNYINHLLIKLKDFFELKNVLLFYPDKQGVLYAYSINQPVKKTRFSLKKFNPILKYKSIIYYEMLRQKQFGSIKIRIAPFFTKQDIQYIFHDSFFHQQFSWHYIIGFSNKMGNKLLKNYEIKLMETLLPLIAFLMRFILIRNELKIVENKLGESEKMKHLALLTSGIVHDVNNILTGINNNIMLLEKRYSFKNREIKSINNLLMRASSIIGQIHDYNKGIQKKENVHIIEVIKESIQIALKVKKKKIRFTLNTKIADIIVHDINNQIIQIFLNLFLNAIDAIKQKDGEIMIDVTTDISKKYLTRLEKHKYVMITICDNGVGIPEKYLKKIFDPFFTTKAGEGTGLGLYMIKELIHSLYGIIDVESTIKKGTKFVVILPYKKIHTIQKPQKQLLVHKKDIKFEGTILIIDDEQLILHSNEKIFSLLGFNIITSSKSEEALAVFKEKSKMIDLVFMDIVMPGLSGIDLADLFLKIKPKIKIIFASGWGHQAKVAKFLKNKNILFLRKPYTIDNVVETLQQLKIKY